MQRFDTRPETPTADATRQDMRAGACRFSKPSERGRTPVARKVRSLRRWMIGWCVAALAAFLEIGAAHALNLPIQIDGRFEDWPASARLAVDPIGDGDGRIDLAALWIANDETRLFLRLDFADEIHADEGHDLTLIFDTDRDPNTGRLVRLREKGARTVGAELTWNLGRRAGSSHVGGGARALDLHALDLLIAPSVSDSSFEIALPRDALAGGDRIFAGPGFDLTIRDGETGDLLQLPLPGYTFAPGRQTVAPIPLERARPADIRIASYNIADDGLFLASRRESLARIFRAVDPDVWVICEAWNHGAHDLAARVEELLPNAPGQRWSGIKLDSGNGIVTRLPVLASWLPHPDARITAALLDLAPQHDTDLLVVANHFSCCAADDERQEQADALIAFLRDARHPGGILELEPRTPIVAVGDFNLVGARRPLVTLVKGDIADESAHGNDSPPDWDGTGFDLVEARHPEARLTHTWRDPASGFYPGKLDYAFHTGSVSIVDRAFVLDTAELSEATLAAYGLRRDDTAIASDHAPLVFDIRPVPGPREPDSADQHEEGVVRIVSLAPDPFSSSTRLSYRLLEGDWIDAEVFDPRGRRIRRIASGWEGAGMHDLPWDGRTDGGGVAAGGRYLIRLRTGRGKVAKWATLLR